jgi:hypothetical protein
MNTQDQGDKASSGTGAVEEVNAKKNADIATQNKTDGIHVMK